MGEPENSKTKIKAGKRPQAAPAPETPKIDNPAESAVEKSEGFSSLAKLFDDYKKFTFGILSRIPYRSVNAWITFADGKVESALEGKRTVVRNIKDAYVLTALAVISSAIAFWYLVVLFGAWFGIIFGALGLILLSAKGIPIIALALAVLAFLVLLAIAPAVMLLFRSAAYHVVAKILGGKGSYSGTMSILTLSSAASLMLMLPIHFLYAIFIGYLISPVSWAFAIYALYLQYRGIRHVHGVSKNRAIGTIIGGIIVETVLLLAFVALVYFGIMLFIATRVLR